MTDMESCVSGSERQDWAVLTAGDLVSVREPQGAAYEAWIDDKTADSGIVWIQRVDLGSRHLIEQRDGIVIIRNPRE
jgi:hypothetical protein